MNKLKFALFGFAALLFGCQQAELADPNEVVGQPMKTVTISAGMDADDTKASLDSQTGEFSWQSGDLISVLATDGKFYDFTLTDGAGDIHAEFEGIIPETAAITTVATYPRIVANGTENTVLSGNILNFVLPASWTYAANVSNVPMVAAFETGSEHMYFRQVGGVMRFPVKNLPKEASFVVTMNDKTITGQFPVDITAVGETAMTAGDAASVLTISYASDVDGRSAEFNVPVPVGVYNNFNVTVKDAAGNDLFSKDYSANNTVNRRTLLMMKELVLPERPVAISEVWPYFVDARVVTSPYEGVTQYAVYVDGAEEPVIKDVQTLDGKATVVFGGNFAHNSTHTVAIAKVVDGVVVPESKSEAVEFTTGRVFQVTYHTGTKFICAGWDDVAIGKENSRVYDETTKKWSLVAKTSASDRNKRGYRIQLYAADKTTLLYDEVPFSSQVDYGGAISNSSWIGKTNGNNILMPSALTLGWLEPGKKYYFRVQTLSEPVVFNSPETDCFEPSTNGYTVSSTRGGSAWSDFVEMTTDEAHVLSDYEVLYESFDDMVYNSDIMNGTPAAVPQILTAATKKDTWNSRESADLYKAWFNKPFADRKFSEQGFNTSSNAYTIGICDDKYTDSNTPRYFNSYAGSLEGWSVRGGGSETRGIYPNVGAVRIGQSDNATGYVELRTPPLTSNLLPETKDVMCRVTLKVSSSTTAKAKENPTQYVGIYKYRNGEAIGGKPQFNFAQLEDGKYQQEWEDNYSYTDDNNYLRYATWFEVTYDLPLRKGDIVAIDRPNTKVNGVDNIYRGFLILGEVKIEVLPNTDFDDNGVGTEPNDINYDVYGLGEFPISYWWAPPTNMHNYDDAKTRELYQTMAESGINTVLYYGEVDCSLEENLRIMGIAGDLGMKFIGNLEDPVRFPTNSDKIAAIKQYMATSDTYVGEYLADEPSASDFDEIGAFTTEYLKEIPNKEVYVNLFPFYASSSQLGTATYEQHIDKYLAKVPTKSLSYDYYGLANLNSTTDYNVKNSYFQNLDMVREKSLALDKPFWVITQAGRVGSNTREPNEKEQRWSVWSTIAGGSKGISYFCYWDPALGGDYDSAMINRDGTKRDIYDWIKKINADINTIGKKLLLCHSDGFIMSNNTYPMYINSGAGRTKYGPITALRGTPYALCGCFRDARRSMSGDNYEGYKVLVMPQLPNTMAYAYLDLLDSVTSITVTHNNTSEIVQLTNTLDVYVGGIRVRFNGMTLSLTIPDGEAALVEF